MTKESMYDLLSKYLAGDISAEERRILFQQLKENEELRKEAAGIQNRPCLFLWRMRMGLLRTGNIAYCQYAEETCVAI